jgi:hypothetical protein
LEIIISHLLTHQRTNFRTPAAGTKEPISSAMARTLETQVKTITQKMVSSPQATTEEVREQEHEAGNKGIIK